MTQGAVREGREFMKGDALMCCPHSTITSNTKLITWQIHLLGLTSLDSHTQNSFHCCPLEEESTGPLFPSH